MTTGIDQFNFLKATRDDFKEQTSEISDRLVMLLNRLLNKNRLNVLYTGENSRTEHVKTALLDAFADLPSEALGEKVDYQPGVKQNEAYITAQDVNYVGTGANASDILDFTGASNVLSTAIRFDYLWNEVRVKGGAYGSLYTHRRNGNFALASYRDPNLAKTLDVYTKLPDYVENLTISEDELNKYVIGTMSPLEQPKSAESKGLSALSRLMTGISREDIVQLKEEILATESDDFAKLAPGIREVLENQTVVVIGNKTQIEAENDLFDEVYTLY